MYGGQDSPHEELAAPKCHSAEAEKPWSGSLREAAWGMRSFLGVSRVQDASEAEERIKDWSRSERGYQGLGMKLRLEGNEGGEEGARRTQPHTDPISQARKTERYTDLSKVKSGCGT